MWSGSAGGRSPTPPRPSARTKAPCSWPRSSAATSPASAERGRRQRPRPRSSAGGAVQVVRSERLDVRRLRALLALLDVERDPLTLIERAIPAGLDGGVVDEYVRSAAVGGGEAKPLLCVEPLDCSFGHCSLLAEVVHRGPASAQGLPRRDETSRRR